MSDTICAIATAPGGAIGIIRLSGPDAFPIVRRVCRRITETTPARTAVYTPISEPSATVPEDCSSGSPSGIPPLDDALVTLFCAPNSYTGEDCAEISCHGSRYILNKVLELLVQQGARLADPGEFTQRAFLNGKLDLSQAEAVADLIASTNRATHDLAMNQLRGGISSELNRLREQLLRLTSLLELELDFSDHEELEFADRTELLNLAGTIDERVRHLARSFETGQALKNGIPVAIVGKTNVGKSTLLNTLLRDDRAIVSDVHGTTRDTIEDTMDLHGITFRFIDTAGLRETDDVVEQIGIERTYKSIEKASIVIWLIDERPTKHEIDEMQELTRGKELLVVLNKIDIAPPPRHSNNDPAQPLPSLPRGIEGGSFEIEGNSFGIEGGSFEPWTSPILFISAKLGRGISQLEEAIFQAAHLPEINSNDIIVTSARHYEALLRAHDSLNRVLDGLHSALPTDLIAEDLRLTLSQLAEITGGAITPQETLNNIFSHFCVGK